MINSILVPLDGSDFGAHALPLAASLARRAGAELHLAHVHLPVPPITVEGVTLMDTLDLHRRQDEQAYLADVSRRLAEAANTPIRMKSVLLDGDVAASLKEYAAKVGAGLVVMSTHGRGAFGRFGSVASPTKCFAKCLAPCVLVRPGEKGKPDLGRDSALRNILVPLDGSTLAEAILTPATALTELFEGTVTLLRVVAPVVRPGFLHEGGGIAGLVHSNMEQVRALQQRHRDEAQAYLDEVAKRVASKRCQVRTRVAIDEEPALSILLEADAGYADLIAMESHGRRALSRLFLGSVADKVVRGAGVPVLLHRQPR